MFDSSSNEDENGFPHAGFLTYKSVNNENHPRYYVKMFVKLVQNYTTYNKQLVRFFGSSDPELRMGEIEATGEMMLYSRAYEYLTKIDPQDKYHIKILFEETDIELEQALNKSLKYFEIEEEYEKCIIIKKYLDFLNFSS
tara:strand:+ start:213 stop:632 length:420 start_codon:yes stop_codon:yes gene_type:complete